MKKLGMALAALIGAAGLVNAQNNGTLSGETASPVPVGSSVTLRIEANMPMELRSACATEVRFGSPTGTVVWQQQFCIFLFVVVGPANGYNNMGWSGTSNTSPQVPIVPGTYYIKFEGRDLSTGNPYVARWVPVRLDPVSGPTAPVLKGGAATRGAPLALALSDSTNPFAQYWMAASLGTNSGQNLGALGHFDLDFDALFYATLNGLAGLTTGFQGTLDANGSASATLFIPNIPALQGAQVAVQAAVTNSLVFSNSVQKVIG